MHVMHECPNAPTGLLESLQENYGYPEDEKRIPLNIDESYHKRETNKENSRLHERCPYCGQSVDDMEPAKQAIVNCLNRRPRHF